MRRNTRIRAMVEGQRETASEEKKQQEIPVDVCALKILPCVSAKHLQTLKLVSKDWLQLINNPYFERLHLSRANRGRIRVLVTSSPSIVEYCSYYEKTTPVPYPPRIPGSYTKMIGSADGLICLLEEISLDIYNYYRCAVYNPSTRKFLWIQLWPHSTDHYTILCSWFGTTGAVVGEYVLVLGMITIGPTYEFGVYKFTRNNYSTNLKRIHSVCVDLQIPPPIHVSFTPLETRGILVHGAVHWAMLRFIDGPRPYFRILAYHLHKNTQSEFLPPAQCDFRLGLVDGCLCATLNNNHVFELWIMKETWTKYGIINLGFSLENSRVLSPLSFFPNGDLVLDADKSNLGFSLENSRVLSPLGFFPNGDLVLDADKSKLIKYNFNDNQVTLLADFGCTGHDAIMCADSLVSPAICLV